MFEFFIILLISCIGAFGLAHAINYFWRIGMRKSIAYASFALGVFLVFWLSGVWENPYGVHSIGTLTPVIFLIIAIGIIIVFIGKYIWKKSRSDHKPDDSD